MRRVYLDQSDPVARAVARDAREVAYEGSVSPTNDLAHEVEDNVHDAITDELARVPTYPNHPGRDR